MKISRFPLIASLCLALAIPTAAHANEEADEQTENLYTTDWLTVGIGVISAPTYSGSDEDKFVIGGAVMGRVEGFNVTPRIAGLAVDLIRDDENDVSLTFGPAARARFNRTSSDLEDPVVESLGKLDTAIEAGFVVGLGFNKVLHDYDHVDVGMDVRWDLASAHEGMVISPSVSYQTPLSRGAALQLVASAEYLSGKTSRYYWNVSPDQSVVSGLPTYEADSGFNGASLLAMGILDLNGNLLDGGFALYAGGGYQRLTGDAADSPITRLQGKKDQLFLGVGIGYTFM